MTHYTNQLDRLHKRLVGAPREGAVEWLKDTDKVIRCIDENFENSTTRWNMLIAATSVLGRLPGFDEAYRIYSDLSKQYRETYQERRAQNIVSEKDDGKIPDWQAFVSSLDKLRDQTKRAIYGVYALLPPRRLEYRMVRIGNEKDDTSKGNWYIPEKGFVFNEYKTDKVYGRQEVPAPEHLQNILTAHINATGKKEGDYLFTSSRSGKIFEPNGWTRATMSAFSEATGIVGISVNRVRQSFATWLHKQPISKSEKTRLAWMMGHSLDTSLDYNKVETQTAAGPVPTDDD